MNGRTLKTGWALPGFLMRQLVVAICLLAVIAGVIAYELHRVEESRAPRALPNGYSVAPSKIGGATSWSLRPPKHPLEHIRFVDADGEEQLGSWWVTRLAVGGDTLIVLGQRQTTSGQLTGVVFEVDTRTGAITPLPDTVAAEQRVNEFKATASGGDWVNLDALPRVPKPK